MNRQLHVALRRLCRQSHVHRRNYSANPILTRQPIQQGDLTLVQQHTQSVGDEDASPFNERHIETNDRSSQNPNERPKSRKQLRTDMYLASLHEQGTLPSIEDIERFRPEERLPVDSPKYPIAYKNLIGRLCKSFTKDQLRHLGELYGLEKKWTRHGRRIAEYAESIIDKQWGWENLKEVERRTRDSTEMVTKSFPLSASQLFVLMGKDGSELHNLAHDYNVRFSVTSNPLTLQVRGLRGMLKKLEPEIASRRNAMVEETFELPSKSGLPPEIVPQISQLANAYIENIGHKGKVRICARDKAFLDAAKRIVCFTATHESHASRIPLFTYKAGQDELDFSISQPELYALYPFSPYPQSPWWLKSGNAFRLRRVGGWSTSGTTDLISSDETNESLISISGHEWSLEDVFLHQPLTGHRTIIASTGHILFADVKNQHSSLTPPLSGTWRIADFKQKVRGSGITHRFDSNLPPPLHNYSMKEHQNLHRLTYRHLPEWNPETSVAQSGAFARSKVLEFEVNLHHVREHDGPEESTEDTVENSPVGASLAFENPPTCIRKDTTDFLLSLPGRSMDLKLSIVDSTRGSMESFLPMNAYMDSLKEFLGNPDIEQPYPPLLVKDNDDVYVLENNTTVRRKREVVSAGSPTLSFVGVEVPLSPRSIPTVVEEALNLETHEKSRSCEVHSENPSTLEDLKTFLSDCDALVANAQQTFHTKPLTDNTFATELDSSLQ